MAGCFVCNRLKAGLPVGALHSLAADAFAAAGDEDGMIKLDELLINALYKVTAVTIASQLAFRMWTAARRPEQLE